MAEGGILRDLVANPTYKLLSLAIAVGAWMYVQSGQLSDAKVRAVIEWKLPPGLSTTEPLPATVMIGVQGTRSATRRAQRADVTVSADLSDAEVGEHVLEFGSLEVRGLPPAVHAVGFSPSAVRMVLDEQAVRKVKVQPVTVGDPATGYSVLAVTVEPAVIELRGPRVVMSDLRDVSTKPIDVSSLTADVEAPVELDLPWGIAPASGDPVRVRIDVEPVLEQRTFEGVPVIVQVPGFGPSVPSVQVVLRGPAGALQDMDPDSVFAIARLPDAPSPSRSSYDVAWGPPDGPRLEVVFPGDPAVIQVTAVRPGRVEVVRQ
jgi:hypothetical protein